MNTRVIQIYCSAAALAALAATALTASPRADAADPATTVARGKYLVNTSGCHDCHTPFKPGPNGPEPAL